MKSLIAVLLLAALATPVQDTFQPDDEGFIRNWLVLAPMALEGESGATEIDAPFLPNEALLKPKADERAAPRGSQLTWMAHQTSDYFIDFLESFGASGGEYVAAYAVTYVTVEADTNVTLSIGTNDQGKAWLNGKEIVKFVEARTLEKDSSRAPVTLVKGQNVLVMKVINEVNNWQACARFLRGESPFTDFKVSVVPK